ncbi:hypothetical protein H4582DRAFT_1487657 [Lactarius indigo]|nr:hypothetical protein H4582DRAFT_1487657 [Lactarius indigo]
MFSPCWVPSWVHFEELITCVTSPRVTVLRRSTIIAPQRPGNSEADTIPCCTSTARVAWDRPDDAITQVIFTVTRITWNYCTQLPLTSSYFVILTAPRVAASPTSRPNRRKLSTGIHAWYPSWHNLSFFMTRLHSASSTPGCMVATRRASMTSRLARTQDATPHTIWVEGLV